MTKEIYLLNWLTRTVFLIFLCFDLSHFLLILYSLFLQILYNLLIVYLWFFVFTLYLILYYFHFHFICIYLCIVYLSIAVSWNLFLWQISKYQHVCYVKQKSTVQGFVKIREIHNCDLGFGSYYINLLFLSEFLGWQVLIIYIIPGIIA